MKRFKNSVQTAPRTAFTLLEVLIAIALSLLLLSAVYGAMNLSHKFSVAGQASTERSQIGREVLRRIATDIRAVVQKIDVANPLVRNEGLTTLITRSNQEKSSLTITATNREISSQIRDSAFERNLLDVHDLVFAGNTKSVLFRSSGRNRWHGTRLEPQSDGTGFKSMQPKLIAYVVLDGGPVVLPSALKKAIGSSWISVIEREQRGLARIEITLPPPNRNDPRPEIDASDVQVAVLAEEIVGLQFRYFDGTSWRHEFDFHDDFALPWSVEIRIQLAATENNRIGFGVADEFRLITDLPTTDRFESEPNLKTGRPNRL